MLGEGVNPHREWQTIPQGQTSIPPKSFLTPTAKARPNQAAIATAAETPDTTHRARPRSPFSHTAADEKRPMEKFGIANSTNSTRPTNSVVRLNQTHAVSHNTCGLCVPRRRCRVFSLSLRLNGSRNCRMVPVFYPSPVFLTSQRVICTGEPNHCLCRWESN